MEGRGEEGSLGSYSSHNKPLTRDNLTVWLTSYLVVFHFCTKQGNVSVHFCSSQLSLHSRDNNLSTFQQQMEEYLLLVAFWELHRIWFYQLSISHRKEIKKVDVSRVSPSSERIKLHFTQLTFLKCAVFVFISLKRFSRFSWNGLREAETRLPCNIIPSSKISTCAQRKSKSKSNVSTTIATGLFHY